MIKLTNIAEGHKDNPLYINPDWIVAIFPVASESGGSLKTIIYGGPTGSSWEVEESPEEIKKMMRSMK